MVSHIVVIVPARNEHDLIERCVRSLEAACDAPLGVSATVVVVADCCTDDTALRARRTLRRRHRVVQVTAGSAGAARRAGTEHALDALDAPLDRVWVATTDADTVVDADWLTLQLEFARDGAIAVAGIVDLLDSDSLDADLVGGFRSAYTVNVDGTHPHVHAANLGFRADAYRDVGGWNPLASGEDHDLWNRLCTIGPTVSTTALRVHTSARLTGRAPEGFAADVAALAGDIATVA